MEIWTTLFVRTNRVLQEVLTKFGAAIRRSDFSAIDNELVQSQDSKRGVFWSRESDVSSKTELTLAGTDTFTASN